MTAVILFRMTENGEWDITGWGFVAFIMVVGAICAIIDEIRKPKQ